MLHCRLRGGSSHAGRGAASLVVESINRARAAGATGDITLRADSGFYNHKVVGACRKMDVRLSSTVRLTPALHKAIAAIDEEAWVPIDYFQDGAAVAETTYTPFAKRQGATPVRLIVRRVPPSPGSQLALFAQFSHHALSPTDQATCSPSRPTTGAMLRWKASSATSNIRWGSTTCRRLASAPTLRGCASMPSPTTW